MIPSISVVVPMCNVEKYIEQCLCSIMEQSFTDIEIICVDDGSTDKTLETARKCTALDNRVRIIAKKNSGYGDSVNIGLSECKGKYISIIESDDYIEKNMFSELYSFANDNVDIIKGNFYDCYDQEDGSIKKIYNEERKGLKYLNEVFDIYDDPEILRGHPSIWSALYRRDFLEKNNIKMMKEPGGGWVDNPFFFETLYLAKKIIWTNKAYYNYRKTNNNSSSNKQYDLTLPLRRMMDNLNVLNKYKCNDTHILKVAYARAFMYLNGLFESNFYNAQIDHINYYAQKMMLMMKEQVVLENFNQHDKNVFYKYISPLNNIPVSGKILIYNWIQFDNPMNIGGGVNIYCRNLIETIIRKRPDIKIYFLSSGWAYDATTTECYLKSTQNIYGRNCRSVEIVNSPIPAAQSCILNNPSIACKNDKLVDVFNKFLQEYGDFDVIHFNNIEGLSLDILDLKNKYINTKFIFSIHNYVPFCVTGFYYQRFNHCNCHPDKSGDDCLKCTEIGRNNNISSELYIRATNDSKSEKKFIPYSEWIRLMGFDRLDYVSQSSDMLKFIRTATQKIRDNIDINLAVSERVRDIAIANGLLPDKVKTVYIGTKIADSQRLIPRTKDNNKLKIVYLGSDMFVEEKGYNFLIESLSKLDSKYAKKIDLFLTYTKGNEESVRQNLVDFNSVTFKRGYNHNELSSMLSDADLGIIPVLWEDNLPQIAIEMVAMGVPVLSSNYGGASELCRDELFKFKGGDTSDLLKRIEYFTDNKNALSTYWDSHDSLITMDKHLEELESIYDFKKIEEVKFTINETALLSRYCENVVGSNISAYDSYVMTTRSYRRLKILLKYKNLLVKGISSLKLNGVLFTLRKACDFIKNNKL